jgi:hypothetical protein
MCSLLIALMLDAATNTSETLVNFYQTVQHNISKDIDLLNILHYVKSVVRVLLHVFNIIFM